MFEYQYFNPNKEDTKKRGCVKRAIAAATGKDYFELENFILENQVDSTKPYNACVNYEHIIELLGGHKIIISNKRWHINEICDILKDYDNTSFILYVQNHLIGIRNNTIYDIVDDRISNKCVWILYVFNPKIYTILNNLLG